jgi:hypothetical protein
MNFALKQHHGWSITELEAMMPYEREIYIIMLKQFLEEERRKQENKQNG